MNNIYMFIVEILFCFGNMMLRTTFVTRVTCLFAIEYDVGDCQIFPLPLSLSLLHTRTQMIYSRPINLKPDSY